MSRHYEALTRRLKGSDEPAGVNWMALDVDAAGAQPEAPAEAGAQPSKEAPAPSGVLGKLIRVAVNRRARLLPYATDPVVVEQYRRLRTKILQQRESRSISTLMVASGSPQEGKTLTVLNLAFSFAMIPGFRVLVVEGDLRKGTLREWLGIDSSLPGFSNLIEGSASLPDVVVTCEDFPIAFMPRGTSKNAPAELLNTPALSQHLAAMAAQFDLVLVDSPPVHLFTDAPLLAAGCDAVLLVARAFSTNGKGFERIVHELDPAKVIGAVLNGATVPHSHRYGYDHYYREKA